MGEDKTDMVLAGGETPRQRSGRRSDWTEAMADKFARVLAETCNVTLAAKAIRRSISNVYKQRAKDASFRRAWDQALAIGYSQLELMMLERALHGTERVIILKSGETKVMRQYSDRVALALLRHHRDTVALTEDSIDDTAYMEARERIISRLELLAERTPPPGLIETKGRARTIDLIVAGPARGHDRG